jgi:hypothetical protein
MSSAGVVQRQQHAVEHLPGHRRHSKGLGTAERRAAELREGGEDLRVGGDVPVG